MKTVPLALILVGVGLIFVGYKGYDAGAFFFGGKTVPA